VNSLVARARDLSRTPKFRKLVRYGSVSVISTLLTNILLFVFYDKISLGSAMECNALATGIVTIPAYYLNRTWTWRKQGKSDFWREVAPFWVIAAFALALSTVVVGITAHNADHIAHTKLTRSLLLNAANIITYGAIWVVRFTLYNRFLFREPPAGAGDAEVAETEPAHHHVHLTEHEHQLIEGLVTSGIAPADDLETDEHQLSATSTSSH
jgi:putative flippase GtrA